MNHVENYIELVEHHRKLKNFTDKYIEFYMEDFIKPDSTMRQSESDRLCDFLGVSKMKLISDSKKLTPDKDHWSYFENADEIKEMINEC